MVGSTDPLARSCSLSLCAAHGRVLGVAGTAWSPAPGAALATYLSRATIERARRARLVETAKVYELGRTRGRADRLHRALRSLPSGGPEWTRHEPRPDGQLHLGAADLIRDTFKRGKHQDVILPLRVLRRLDCVLARTRRRVLAVQTRFKGRLDSLDPQLQRASGFAFYNTSRCDFEKLLADAPHIAQNLRNYIAGFSPTCARCSRSST